ncbi:MAG: hypothetical protein R2831_08340 [Chitinophagaceae bacterium]
MIWLKKPNQDSVQISYRTLPFLFSKKYFHKDVKSIEPNLSSNTYYYDGICAAQNHTKFIEKSDLNYSGSFGRILSFGNNQDVVLNSQFNLQLDGDLGDSIKLTGVITDNNVPFQPQGNTQQIQEFDKVFIGIQRKRTAIWVGDIEIKKPQSYFMQFYKRVQGAQFSQQYNITKNAQAQFKFGASLAKGKFVRNTLTALEGNQGPYKLSGPNGEQFFIVLAGTERVYIDGIQMQRGEQLDYVIDYNTAEITFMPRRIITKDLRLVVEFEFSDRNYINSLFYFEHGLQMNKKTNINFAIYSNQDAKNQSVNQTLDSTQRYFLSTVGDSIQQAYIQSAIFQDTFSTNQIRYKKIDTLVNGILYPNVYVFSTNKDSANFIVNYSYVGSGKGNYVQSISSANGRVYAWVSPVNQQKQGDFEPVILLVTPKKIQMSILNVQHELDSNKNFQTEIAVSQYDPNTFSSIDNNTHIGIATKLIYQEKRILSKKHDIALNSNADYEFVQNNFKVLERYRNVEFARDWNINTNSLKPNHEHLAHIGLNLQHKQSSIHYELGTFIRTQEYSGLRHLINLHTLYKGYEIAATGNILKQKSQLFKSEFYRPSLTLSKSALKNNKLLFGLNFLLEHNHIQDATTDSLLPQAFSFDALTLFAKTNQQEKNSFNFSYTLRHDRAKKQNEFKQSTVGNTFSLISQINTLKNQQLLITCTYRTLAISDTTITTLQGDESLLGRIEYDVNFLKQIINGHWLYEFGSGQEQKREFTYVEVPTGQGIYVWRDYNQDGLKQLNEFEIAVFQDEKKYIKIFTPTNQYVKAKYSLFNQSITINPRILFNRSNEKGIKKVLSMLYAQSVIQLNNRFIGQQGISQYNPFINSFDDSLLVSQNSNIVNSIFINRISPIWGLDYIQNFGSNKTLLNYGVDGKKNLEHQVRARVNAGKNITISLSGRHGYRAYTSKYLENRNYRIKIQNIEPSVQFIMLKNNLRYTISYKYDERNNDVRYGNEKAKSHQLNVDFKYNLLNKGSLNALMTYANINYNGLANTTIAYSMLDALLPGQNWVWQLRFDRRLSNSIEMGIEYDGRKSSTNTVVHTGRASLRAIF